MKGARFRPIRAEVETPHKCAGRIIVLLYRAVNGGYTVEVFGWARKGWTLWPSVPGGLSCGKTGVLGKIGFFSCVQPGMTSKAYGTL